MPERLGLEGFRFVAVVYLEERAKGGNSCGLDEDELRADFEVMLREHGATVFSSDISSATSSSERRERKKSLLAMIHITTHDDRDMSNCSAYIHVDFSTIKNKIEFEVGSEKVSTFGSGILCRGTSLAVRPVIKRSDVKIFTSHVVEHCIERLSKVTR